MLQQDFYTRLAGIALLLPLGAAVFFGGVFATLAVMLICLLLAAELAFLLGRSNVSTAAIAVYLLLPPAFLYVEVSALIVAAILLLGLVVTAYVKDILAGIYAFSLALCFCAFAFLVNVPGFFTQLLGLALVIAFVDSGAYLVGRRFRGPKLAPMISPKKTISGAVGGILFGLFGGVLVAPFLDMPMITALLFAAVISVVAQCGDLFESALKRRFNVKDSSALIPGHGGFLDRFDGYVFVVPLIALLHFIA